LILASPWFFHFTVYHSFLFTILEQPQRGAIFFGRFIITGISDVILKYRQAEKRNVINIWSSNIARGLEKIAKILRRSTHFHHLG
jgi:hypothetical protein